MQVLGMVHHILKVPTTSMQCSIEIDSCFLCCSSLGLFPAEMVFTERVIPALVDAGIEWVIVANTHISRACKVSPPPPPPEIAMN